MVEVVVVLLLLPNSLTSRVPLLEKRETLESGKRSIVLMLLLLPFEAMFSGRKNK